MRYRSASKKKKIFLEVNRDLNKGRETIYKMTILRIIAFLPGLLFDKKLKMKGLFYCAIVLLVCVLVQVQGKCVHNEENLPVGTHIRECKKINCHPDGSMSELTCPLWHCREQIGYREMDISKPYPECCGGPICKED